MARAPRGPVRVRRGAVDRDRRLRGRLLRPRRAAPRGVQFRALRPREHGPGRLVDRARRPAADDGHRRRADLAARRPHRRRCWPRSPRSGSSGRARRSSSSSRPSSSALGALPVFWLARKHLESPRAALGFALAYLLYPPVQWLVLDDFHAGRPRVPASALRLLVPGRGPALALRGLRRPGRPDQGGDRVRRGGLGLWYALARGQRRAGLLIAAAGSAASLLAILAVLPAFGEGESDFYRRYGEVGGSPGGIVETALTDPIHVLEVAFDGTGLGYLVRIAAPLALALLAPLTLRCRPARARDQPALVDPDSDVDPLPLHRGDHPGIRRRQHLRRRPDHSTAAAGGGAARGDYRRARPRGGLAARSDPAVGARTRRRGPRSRRLAGGRARPDRRAGTGARPGRRRGERLERARRAPLRPPPDPQLPVPRRRGLGRRRRAAAELRRPRCRAASRPPRRSPG